MSGLTLALHPLDLICMRRVSEPGSLREWTENRPSCHTRYRLSMATDLSPCDKNDIVLAGVDVVIFENEEFVDAVFLQGSDLDYRTDGADETAVEHEVLLPAHL